MVDLIVMNDNHISSFWEILKEWPEFWLEPKNIPKGFKQFRSWWIDTVKFGVTGIDTGQVIGGAYLDNIYPGYYATINIFKKKNYLNANVIKGLSREGLPMFFKEFDIVKLVGLVPYFNTTCLNMLKLVGFDINGIIPLHQKINGEWVDYVYSSYLKEYL